MKLLSEFTTGRDNNFNLIRFVAAFLVLFSHSFVVTVGHENIDPLASFIGLSIGTIAVDIFFITSGFLVTSSLILRNNLIAFAWNRVLRIFPALIVAVLFSVLVVGSFFTTLDITEYFLESETYKYLIKNITLVAGSHGTLPYVFEDAPYKNVVNASIWTLPWEVRMYGLLFILGIFYYLFNWFNKKFLLMSVLVIAVLSLAVYVINNFLGFIESQRLIQSLRFLALFFIGSSFYLLKNKILLSPRIAVIMFLSLLVSLFHKDVFFVLYYIFIAYIVVLVAYVPSGKIRSFNKIGDYSYGLYIYGFPVQQSIVAMYPDISVLTMIVVSFFITFIFAYISWHLIEKKMLKNKGKYIHIENLFRTMAFKR